MAKDKKKVVHRDKPVRVSKPKEESKPLVEVLKDEPVKAKVEVGPKQVKCSPDQAKKYAADGVLLGYNSLTKTATIK